jgi:PAS domain-containing protein
MESEDRVSLAGRRWFDEDVTGRWLARPDWTFIECNTAFAQMLGVEPPSGLVGRKATEFAADPFALQKLLAVARERGAAGPLDLQFERADGDAIDVSISIRSGWRQSAGWQAAWRTISTIY